MCGSVGHAVSISLSFLLLKDKMEMVPGVRGGVEISLKGKSLGVCKCNGSDLQLKDLKMEKHYPA